MGNLLLIVDKHSVLSRGIRTKLRDIGYDASMVNIDEATIYTVEGEDDLSESSIFELVDSYDFERAILIPSILSSEVEASGLNIDAVGRVVYTIRKAGVKRLYLLSSVWAVPDAKRGRHRDLWLMEEAIRHRCMEVGIIRVPLVYGLEGDMVSCLLNESVSRVVMIVPVSREAPMLFIGDLVNIICSWMSLKSSVNRAIYLLPLKKTTFKDIARNARISAERRGMLIASGGLLYKLLSGIFRIRYRKGFLRVRDDFFRFVNVANDGFGDDFSYNFTDVVEWIDMTAEKKRVKSSD